MDYKEILKQISKKNFWIRNLIMIMAVFVLAINYNVFFLHNNLVVGGTSGIATIIHSLTGLSPSKFIFIFNFVLILISFILLGKEKTSKTIIGSMIYPVFVELSIPLCNKIIPYTNFDNMFLTILVAALIFGICNGVIYKTGYTTGGADILMQIVNKYFLIPTGKSSFFVNFFIVGAGGLVFGWTKVLYAIIIIVINTIIVDRMLIGISDSKMFFIYTSKESEVAGFIINEIHAGYTILTTEGGYSKTKRKMIMCVVPTKDYYLFKESVLQIDPNAFFVISDCYEVSGGFKRTNLPFI
ncbi:MAG: YitT family protein [Bacilli bacterium]